MFNIVSFNLVCKSFENFPLIADMIYLNNMFAFQIKSY